MTSSTPKNRVKPTATRAYMVPSMSPLIRYCSAISTRQFRSWPSWPDLFRPSTTWFLAKEDVDGRDKHGHDDSGIQRRHFFSLRLPEAYSLSSQITHLPSWATNLVISGTVFCPWSSKVTGPTMES